MKKYLIQFKPFLIFVGTFFLVYITLTLIYGFYLNTYQTNDLDGITVVSGQNAEQLMHFFNYDVVIQKNALKPWLDVAFNGENVIRIIEGCNAVSVMILFVAFVLAFSGKFKTTLLFILFGILSIYILNVLRIILLTVLLYHYPNQTHLLHGVLFPLIIYGYVFILWIIWINRFSKYAK